MRSLFVAIVFVLLLTTLSRVAADNSVWTSKSTYQIGDMLTVCVATNGGKVGLVLSGPYTINVDLGNLPQGTYCFQIGTVEQRDIGPWTVTMHLDTSVPFVTFTCTGNCPPSGSATAYFNVVGSQVPEFTVPFVILGISLIGVSLIIRRSVKRHKRVIT